MERAWFTDSRIESYGESLSIFTEDPSTHSGGSNPFFSPGKIGALSQQPF